MWVSSIPPMVASVNDSSYPINPYVHPPGLWPALAKCLRQPLSGTLPVAGQIAHPVTLELFMNSGPYACHRREGCRHDTWTHPSGSDTDSQSNLLQPGCKVSNSLDFVR